jgi:hypothetical protein
MPPMRLRLLASAALAVLVACDLEVDTHYGPHSGLQKANLPDPTPSEGGVKGDGGAPCGTPVDAGACSVSYSGQIWPKMSGTWHCSDANCHGAMVNQPFNLDNATDAYNNLMALSISGKPYLNPCSIDPDASAFVCNTTSPGCGAGGQMPFPNSSIGSGPMSPTDMALVQTWVQCGAPNN